LGTKLSSKFPSSPGPWTGLSRFGAPICRPFAVDLLDPVALAAVFAQLDSGAVIHFAGFKAVAKSVRDPLAYYRNNVLSTINLCACMAQRGWRNIVFSSSATVYGNPQQVPLREDAPLSAGSTPMAGQN